MAEANGTTHFVFAPAPDKSSAYRNLIDEPLASLPSLADWPELTAALPMPPVFSRLREAAERGKDVYLPNDTHWGWRGQQAYVDALLDYLQDNGLLIPSME